MLFQLTPAAMPDGYGEAVLSVDACKAHLGITPDVIEFDDLIAALRDASIDMVEKYTNLFLGPRADVIATFSAFCTPMRLGRGPEATVSVTGVSYIGSDNAAVALETGDWRIDAIGGVVPAINARWPASYGPVTVTFDAGFPADECPPTLLAAAKMFLAHLFTNREAVVTSGASGELPLGFRMLCNLHRMPII
jgi:uncharacterized phiE125 gp8 family phage protein